MKSKYIVWISLLLAALNTSSGEEGAEEMVELSPFTVSSESEGYVAGSMSRSRVLNVDNAPSPTVPITVVKRADAVAVQFVLRNDSEKNEIRNKELFDSVGALEAAAKAAGFTIEQREVRFSGADRKMLSFSKGQSSSFVNLVVIAPLKDDLRVADIVKAVRELFSEKRIAGRTKVADGTVGLVLKNPGQYRPELLERIFADVELVKKGVGPDFEVQLSGLNKPVQLRPSGEGALELWIDYSFTISSIRVITKSKG